MRAASRPAVSYLVPEAAPEVAALLASCPSLKVLATSRAALRVRGEREYPVAPLAMPDPSRTPDMGGMISSPAADLFVGRAWEVNPSFFLTRENAAVIAAICWRLDGLPLALELAAARARFLGPTELLSRLDRALESGGARDLPVRQRTMRSTLDWSYDLLSDEEQNLFRRLSVFAGGFTLEAAEAVGVGDAADVLGRLVEQSESEVVARERGDTFTLAVNLNTQATIAQLRGDDARTSDLLRESGGVLAALRDTWSLLYGVFGLAGVAARHGDPERAARLFGAAEALYEKTGAVPAFPATQALYERDLASLRAQLDTETFEAAWAEGRAMTLEEAVAESLEE